MSDNNWRTKCKICEYQPINGKVHAVCYSCMCGDRFTTMKPYLVTKKRIVDDGRLVGFVFYDKRNKEEVVASKKETIQRLQLEPLALDITYKNGKFYFKDKKKKIMALPNTTLYVYYASLFTTLTEKLLKSADNEVDFAMNYELTSIEIDDLYAYYRNQPFALSSKSKNINADYRALKLIGEIRNDLD